MARVTASDLITPCRPAFGIRWNRLRHAVNREHGVLFVIGTASRHGETDTVNVVLGCERSPAPVVHTVEGHRSICCSVA